MPVVPAASHPPPVGSDPSADLRPPSSVSMATARPARRGAEVRDWRTQRRGRSGRRVSLVAGPGRVGREPPPRRAGQSGRAGQYGGARRGRGGGGARRAAGGAEAPPSRGRDAGSAFPTFLRLPGRPGLPLCGLRQRLVPALARWLRLGRQRQDVQLAPGADGDGHGGALRRSGPGVSPAPRLEGPQVPLEGAARHPGPGSFSPGRAGFGGRFSLPQRPRDAQHVFAAQLGGAGHRPALLLPVGGRLRRLPAALGSCLAPCPLQTRPRLLRLHHPHALPGLLRVGHQREALLQPEERDNGIQAPARRGRLRQHAGAPHPAFRGAGAGCPGQAELEAPRCRLPGLSPAPAHRRALTPAEVLPALPGLPAPSSLSPWVPCLLCPRPVTSLGTPAASTPRSKREERRRNAAVRTSLCLFPGLLPAGG